MKLRWLVAAALASSAVARSAEACSIRGIAVDRRPGVLRFMVAFRADTALAGAGAVKPRNEMGHFGRGDRREIYGQLATVTDLPASSARILPPGTETVVLVPWDYAADCSTVPWGRSARWRAPGREGLMSAALRAREHWANGIPTFDIWFPQLQPYDPAAASQAGTDSLAATAMPARQLMHLLDSLPAATWPVDTMAERAVIARFANDSVTRRRYPIATIYGDAISRLNDARLRTVRAPFAGTLRLDVSVDGGPWRRLWVRTNPSPAHELFDQPDGAPRPEDHDPLAPYPYTGYTLMLHFAHTRDSLIRNCEARSFESPMGYVQVPWHSRDAWRRAGTWMLHFESGTFGILLTPAERARSDSATRAFWDDLRRRGFPSDALRERTRYDIRARRSFRGRAVQFSGETEVAGVGRLRVRGTQVDTVTVSCRFW